MVYVLTRTGWPRLGGNFFAKAIERCQGKKKKQAENFSVFGFQFI
jgi:hypothetical protein